MDHVTTANTALEQLQTTDPILFACAVTFWIIISALILVGVLKAIFGTDQVMTDIERTRFRAYERATRKEVDAIRRGP